MTSSRGLGAEIAFAVDADADGVGFHVAVADDEHGVDFHLLGVRDLGFHVIAAGVELGADLMGAEFGLNCAGVFEQRRFVADREDADLFGREPEREVAGVMLDEEADETFVRAERRAVNAERRLLGVVAVFVDEAETVRARRNRPGWWRW